MLEKLKIIKEQRLAEAIDRNYMGLEGKFGTILKYLGYPIISQESGYFKQTEWKDVYELENEETLPEEDPDGLIKEIGKSFEGLKYGYHIELSYLKEGSIPVQKNKYRVEYEPASRVLKVSYKGYLVYLEAEGELHIFTPMQEWEDIIVTLYGSAKKIQKQYKIDNSLEDQKENKKRKLGFLENLRKKWGI